MRFWNREILCGRRTDAGNTSSVRAESTTIQENIFRHRVGNLTANGTSIAFATNGLSSFHRRCRYLQHAVWEPKAEIAELATRLAVVALLLSLVCSAGCVRKNPRVMLMPNMPAAPGEKPSSGAQNSTDVSQRRAQDAIDHVKTLVERGKAPSPTGTPDRPEAIMGTAWPQARGTGGTSLFVTTTTGPGTPPSAGVSGGQSGSQPAKSVPLHEHWRIAGASVVAALLIAGVLWGPRLVRRLV